MKGTFWAPRVGCPLRVFFCVKNERKTRFGVAEINGTTAKRSSEQSQHKRKAQTKMMASVDIAFHFDRGQMPKSKRKTFSKNYDFSDRMLVRRDENRETRSRGIGLNEALFGRGANAEK